MKKIICSLLFLILLCVISTTWVNAQETSSGIATVAEVKGNAQDGDIIVLSNSGYVKSSTPYDPAVFGIVTENPAVTLEDWDPKTQRAILTSGKVYIRVSARNGNIQAGDLITTSDLPGVGMKATQSGYVIATALEEYKSTNPNATGKILAGLHITYNANSQTGRENLIKNFRTALEAPVLTPLNALRYIVAGLIVIVSVIIGITFFGRAAVMGVQAIGRNPIAERTITLNVLLHMVLTLAIMSLGLIIAYIILIF